ncbi:hypothetical protein RFI_33667, partial [Reticulomyxa filosa]
NNNNIWLYCLNQWYIIINNIFEKYCKFKNKSKIIIDNKIKNKKMIDIPWNLLGEDIIPNKLNKNGFYINITQKEKRISLQRKFTLLLSQLLIIIDNSLDDIILSKLEWIISAQLCPFNMDVIIQQKKIKEYQIYF